MSKLANGFLIAACSVVLAAGGYWFFEEYKGVQAVENCIDRLSTLLALQEFENKRSLVSLINSADLNAPEIAPPAPPSPGDVHANASTKRAEVRQLCVEKPFRDRY
jgi:hypothetical protein